MKHDNSFVSICTMLACLIVVCCLTEFAMAQRPIQTQNSFPIQQASVTNVLYRSGRAAARNELADKADTLVICPEPFLTTMRPWLEYRRGQGHQIFMTVPAESAPAIKKQIREIATAGNLKTVVLVGDTPSADNVSKLWTVPTDYVPAEVIRKFGSEPEIATDNTYADLDDDGIPDLSIGRISVDSRAALENQIRKVIRYETSRGGEWQRRINFVAGTGGFGQLSDSVIEKTSSRLISDLIPQEYSTTMTYANWSSAYCPDPREFIPTTLKRLNEGSLFWVYMGHGHPHRLDYVRTPIGGFPMFRDKDIAHVNCQQGNPIALMLACYTGAYDFPRDCLAERLVNEPGGPIAAMCGSRVTMPCGMSLLSVGLIEEYFSGERETLGQMFLAAKRKLVLGEKQDAGTNQLVPAFDSRYRDTIRMLGKTLSPAGDKLNAEAQEHAHLFHLLGDPLMRVRRPNQIEMAVQPSEDGKTIRVTGQSPHAGTLMTELVYCRDRFHKRPPRRPEFKWDDRTLDSYSDVYEQSNKKTVSTRTMTVPKGEFEFDLAIPDWAKGRCVVRGYVQEHQSKRYALGASELNIKRR